MAILDIPLTTGVNEEGDTKIPGAGLEVAENVVFDTAGTLMVRGGFEASASTYYSGTAPYHATIRKDRLLTLGDSTLSECTVTGEATAAVIHRGWVNTEQCVCTVAPSSGVGYVRTSSNAYLVTGGATYSLAVSKNPDNIWTRTAGGRAPVVQDAAGNVYTHPWTVSGSGAVAVDACRYGIGAFLFAVGPSGGNAELIYCVGGVQYPVVSFSHLSGTLVATRIAAKESTKQLWFAFWGTSGNIIYAYITIPADPISGVYSGVTAAGNLNLGAYASLEMDWFPGEQAGNFVVFHSTSTASIGLRKYSATPATATQLPFADWGTAHEVPFMPVSKMFNVSGHIGAFVFGVSAPYPEPGNALVLMRLDIPAYDNDGEIVSTTLVQEFYAGVNLASASNIGVLSAPQVDADGSIWHGFENRDSAARYSVHVLRWQPASAATPRTVATDGERVILSHATTEWSGSPALGYSSTWVFPPVVAGGSSTLALGSHLVRVVLRQTTAQGDWRSAATLPQTATITGFPQRITVNAYVNARTVLQLPAGNYPLVYAECYVAPPNSTTYYLVATQQVLPVGLGTTPGPATGLVTFTISAIDTSQRILYELAEPPHTYPGDAVGVAYADGRFWRWRGDTVWFTHRATTDGPPQWAGDTLSIVLGESVRAVGQSRGVPIVITERSVIALEGDGPDVSGSGSYSQRVLTSSGAGCSDPRSVLDLPIGLAWCSVRGIELLPNGSSDIQLISLPVRDTYRAGSFGASAHNPDRNLAIWVGTSGGSKALVYDYVRNSWSIWTLPATASAAFSWRKSLGFSSVVSGALSAFYADAITGSAHVAYPARVLDRLANASTQAVTATIRTGDVRASGLQSSGIWRGCWVLGARGTSITTGVTWSFQQRADGVWQTAQTLPQAGTAQEQTHFRALALFPVATADAVASKITWSLAAENLAAPGDPLPSVTALSFDFDGTLGPSRLGSANRS